MRHASRRAKSSVVSTARADATRPQRADFQPAPAQAVFSAKRSSRLAATGCEEVTASVIPSPTFSRCDLARRGEDVVASFLEKRGFHVCGRNVRVGRLELDLIARRGSLLVVCEVRSRARARPVFPAETIGPAKLARVRRATAMWLSKQQLGRVHARIDAAAVVFDEPGGEPRIEYYENVSYPYR
jgi:putative endonuclease